MTRTHVLSLIAALCLLPSQLTAQLIQDVGKTQTAPATEQVPTTTLVLQPAGEPREALKYRLLPPLLDRTPGNAAIQYGRLVLVLSEEDRATWEKVSDWLETPLDKLRHDEVQTTLDSFKHALGDLDAAARHDRCDWELPFRDGNFLTMELDDLQHLRSLGRLVALKSRLEIADRKFDEAIHTLQTGYALARHVSQGGTVVHGLVGIAIGQLMSARVQEMIQQPGAPNLYWALTSLPQPLFDLRPAEETESNDATLWHPVLQEIKAADHSLASWQHVLDALDRSYADTGLGGPHGQGVRAGATLLALRGYPIAKRALIAEGRTAVEVEAMPVPEVVIRYSLQTYNELRDRTYKWFFVPFPQAREGIREAEHYLKTEGVQQEIIPLASILLPAIGSVNFSVARSERSIALLRVIEALRIFAAGHQGRLPDKLADITEVPVPIDPTTGVAFVYKKTGDTAMIESPIPPERTPRDGLRMEVKIKL